MRKKIKDNIILELIPFIVFVGIIIWLVIMKRASLKTFWIAAYFGLITAFILYKNKKEFGKKCVENLHNNHLIICLLIFIFSGILSNILKATGLIDSLITLFFNSNLEKSFLPMIFFIVCSIISTICGTSTGTISFSVPLFIPIAITNGIDPYLALGAIASGSFFGDHLSPISDTTIISVNSMKCDMYKMMKQRIIIAVIVFLITCTIYILLGKNTSQSFTSNINASDSLKPLLLLMVPIIMLVYLKHSKDIISCLVFSNIFAIMLSLLSGLIDINMLFSSESCVIAGIESVIGVVFFLIVLFSLIGFLPIEKIDKKIENLIKEIKNPFLINLLSCAIIILFILGVSNNTAAMSIESCFINKLFKNKNPEEKANIFDALSVGTPGILPYNTAFMLMISLAFANGINQNDFSLLSVSKYSISCILFIIIYILLALKGCKKDKTIL